VLHRPPGDEGEVFQARQTFVEQSLDGAVPVLACSNANEMVPRLDAQ